MKILKENKGKHYNPQLSVHYKMKFSYYYDLTPNETGV
jgi:hypothetical protein